MVAKIVKSVDSGRHAGEVSCLFASEEHVFSGGADGLIKVSQTISICAKNIFQSRGFDERQVCSNSN